MQYAEHLPNPRRMVVPVVALVVGAAAATGTYALVDEEQVALQPPKVIVAETPAQPGEGVSAKNEAATAAAIGTGAAASSFGKDEAASAAAIGSGAASTGSEGVNAKNEAASAAAIGSGAASTGSEGVNAKNEAASAAAIGSGAASTGSEGVNAKNEAASAAAIGTGSELRGSKASSSGTESEEALRTDPHGSKSGFPGR
jgi:hypothetical protein